MTKLFLNFLEVDEGEAVEADKGVCVGMERYMGEGEAARLSMRKEGGSTDILNIKNKI